VDDLDKQQYIESVQQQLNERFNKYIGLSFYNLARAVGINPDTLKSKLSTVKLVKQMKEFENFNESDLLYGKFIESVSLKTIRLKYNSKPKESMSFEQVKFNEIVRETWETSKLRKKFLYTTFLFVVFEYDGKDTTLDENLYFRGFYVWQMPLETLDYDVKMVWETTKSLVQNGLEVVEVKQGNKTVQTNNLPGIRFNKVAHIRPKANDASDKVFLPNGQSLTKQAYWLNAEYIGKVIGEMPSLVKRHQNTIEPKALDNWKMEVIQNRLTEPIYTYEDFNALASNIVENFEQYYFNEKNLSALGYNIHPSFILVKEMDRPEKYFEQKIFEHDYFSKIVDPIYDSPQFIRKLNNLENSYDLVKVEENTYITINKLNKANINKNDLMGFKKAAELFMNYGEFYTWYSIENNGFQHKLLNMGFDPIFYESLLKRPGALKFMNFNQTTFFVKTIDNFNVSELFQYLMGQDSSISFDDLERKLIDEYGVVFNRDIIIYQANHTELFYSKELERLFINIDAYYQYIEE
jgi:DNA mismatch repair protein MutH